MGRKGNTHYKTKKEREFSCNEFVFFMSMLSKAVKPGKSTAEIYGKEALSKLKE